MLYRIIMTIQQILTSVLNTGSVAGAAADLQLPQEQIQGRLRRLAENFPPQAEALFRPIHETEGFRREVNLVKDMFPDVTEYNANGILTIHINVPPSHPLRSIADSSKKRLEESIGNDPSVRVILP